MDAEIEMMLSRLDLIKDMDPDNTRIFNNARDTLQKAFDEIIRLRTHNNQLLNVIYQNQGSIETGE